MKYEIDVPHFYQLRYAEGGRAMTIEIDMRDTIPCIYRSEVRAWNPPHASDVITDVERDEIVARLYRFLREVKGYESVDIAD